MDRRNQDQFNALQSRQFGIQPSSNKRVEALVLLFTGINQAGQVGALSDLGSGRTTYFGEQAHNVDYQALGDVGDINYGSNLFSSTDGGAFTATVVIPNYAPTFENGLQVVSQSDFIFEHVPGDQGTVFASLNCTVYAIYSDVPANYVYRMLRDNQNEDGAVNSKPYQLNRRNIESIFLKDVDDALTLVSLTQDGDQVLTPQSYTLLEAMTLYDNRLEATSVNRAKIITHTPGIPQTTVNRDTVIELTSSGAFDAEILVCMLDWLS